MKNYEKTSEGALLHEIYLLQRKYDLIKDGTYESVLRNNLRNEIIMIDEFERKGKYSSFGKFLSGLIKGEEDAKVLLGYFLAREYGRATMPEHIDLEPKSKVLADFAKSYASSWVDINGEELEESISNQQNTELVVVQDVAISPIITYVEEHVQGLLDEATTPQKDDDTKQKTGEVHTQSTATPSNLNKNPNKDVEREK